MNEAYLIYFMNLGQIQNFRGGGSILVLLMAVPCRGGRGHPPPENFEIQVLRNVISDVLRPSHGVLRSCFFKPKCHSLIVCNFFDVSGSNLGVQPNPPNPPKFHPSEYIFRTLGY